MNKLFYQLCVFLMILLGVSCQHRQYGYLNKVKVDTKPQPMVSLQKSQKIATKNTRKSIETYLIVNSLDLSLQTNSIKERKSVQAILSQNNQSSKLHEEVKLKLICNIRGPKDPWPKPNRTRDNVDSKIAILLTFFHFISIFPVIEFTLGGSVTDDWESTLSVLIITGFSMIILFYSYRGFNNFKSNTKRKGLLASFISFMYALLFLSFFITVLILLYYGMW